MVEFWSCNSADQLRQPNPLCHVSSSSVTDPQKWKTALICVWKKFTDYRPMQSIQPLPEYCSSVWSPYTATNVNTIEAVQRSFIKISLGGKVAVIMTDCITKFRMAWN
jgi:hypothetical protein